MWLLRAASSGVSLKALRNVFGKGGVDQSFVRAALLPDALVGAAFKKNGAREAWDCADIPASTVSAASHVR